LNLALRVTGVALASAYGFAIHTWWCLPLHCADHHALNGFRRSGKSCGANGYLRHVAGAQRSSMLFDKETAAQVVTTGERRQHALHDVSFGVVKATRFRQMLSRKRVAPCSWKMACLRGRKCRREFQAGSDTR